MHTVSPENIAHRVGVGVRHAGDDVALPSVFRDWQLLIKEHCWEFIDDIVIIAVLICRTCGRRFEP